MKKTILSYPPLSLALAALLMAALAGCQGSPTSPTEPQSPSPAQVEFSSYGLINRARLENGVNPQLELAEGISAVAREYSTYMRDANFLAHQDPMGRDVAQRLQEAGISAQVVGENLVRINNSSDPATWAHQQLMASSTHRPNILGTQYLAVGTGVATDGQSYWLTQIFVRP